MRPGEMPAPTCFQVKRGPFRFGLAPSGKAPGAPPHAASSRYKDRRRSLFSHFLLHLPFTSPNGPLAPSRVARVCGPLSCCLAA